eukprot:6214116-Pleurochrysis_carterae.AAC.1
MVTYGPTSVGEFSSRPQTLSFRITTPPPAHAAKHARTLSRGALRPPPLHVHAPPRARVIATSQHTRLQYVTLV